jgi:PAS domain S-box-containing protein
MRTKKDNKNITQLSHLASFPELSPNPILEINKTGRVIYANPAVLKLFSDHKDLNFKTHYTKDIKKIAEQLAEQGESSQTREICIGNIWHLQMIHYVKETGSIRIYGYDITERKQKDKKIKESEAILKIISTASPVGMVLLGPDRVTHWMSDSLTLINGYTLEEIKGKESRMIYPNDKEFERVGKEIFGKLKFGGIRSTDTQWVHKDGRILDIHISAAAIDPKDLSSGIILIGVDITKPKQMEDVVYRSKQMLQLVLDNIPQRVFWKDLNLRYLGCNTPFAEDARQTPREIIGKDESQLIWESVAEEHQREDKFVIEQEAFIENHEECIEDPDGSIRWIKVNKLPLYDRNGRVFGILGTYEDISGSKKAEQKIRESEERYRIAIEYSNDGVALIKNGKFIYINQKFLHMHGYENQEEVLGKPISLTIHPDDRERVLGYNQNRAQGLATPIRFELKGIKKDDTIIFLEDSATTTIYNGEQVTIAFLRDISERKRTEEEILKSQQEVQALMDALPVAVMWADMQRNVQYINRKFNELFGYTLDDIPTVTVWRERAFPDEAVRENYNTQIIMRVKRLEQGLSSMPIETLITCKDGTQRYVIVLGAKAVANKHMVIYNDITERKQIEEKLRESEERFRLFAENAPLGISIMAPNTKFEYFNFKFTEIFGYTIEDIPDKNTWIIKAYPDEAYRNKVFSQWQKDLTESVNIGVRDSRIYTVRCKDGSDKIINFTIAYLKNGRQYLTYEDITERKGIEEEIKESRDQLQRIMDGSPIAISLADNNSNILYNNNKFIELFGYTVKDIPTIADWRRLAYPDPEYREEVSARIREHILRRNKGEKILPLEIKVACKDGSVCYVEQLAVFLHNNYLTNYVDVTERKKIEEEIITSRNQLQMIVEESPIAMTLAKKDGKVLYNNRRFIELFGYTVEDMPTAADFRRLAYPDPEYRASIDAINAENMEKIMKGEKAQTQYFQITCKDGSIRYVERNFIMLSNLMLATYVDLTERKKAELELAKRADELARSNAELEQFAYIASHDLQEPLRMVASYTELLRHRYEGKLDKDADEFIFYAVDGAARMKRLINDLLLYSRVASKGKPFNLIDCNEIFKQTLINLTMLIEDQHALVTAGPLPNVFADDVQLLQLFQNLIANAIKFHGTLPPSVHVSALKKDNEWVFSVKDNGIGIDPKYYERIFVIFQRLHSKEEYSGTGIGLAVCKRIVIRHGGRIWVESESGKGSDFCFTIPIKGEK